MSKAEVTFSIPQKFKPILTNEKRWEVLMGGAGSGKSYNTAQKVVKRCITEKGHRFLILRKVGRTLRESVFELIQEVLYTTGFPSQLYRINKTDMTISFLHNGSKIIFNGLDDKEKIKSITGITSIWAEEATEFTEEEIDQLSLRLRASTDTIQQITLTLNPVSATHWIKRRFFDDGDDDVFTHHSTYKDNPHLPHEYIKSIEKLKRTNYSYYKIYGLGQWGTLKGLIYDSYEVIDELPQYAEIDVLGLDFGYNHPQALARVKIDGDNAYIDELYYRSGEDNRSMIEWLKTNEQVSFELQCWADAARPDLIDECEKEGMKIGKAKKDVFSGINKVKSYKLHFTRRSVNLIKEIQGYVWKVDRDDNPLDEPIKKNDDGMDAVRYAIFTEAAEFGTGNVSSFIVKGI